MKNEFEKAPIDLVEVREEALRVVAEATARVAPPALENVKKPAPLAPEATEPQLTEEVSPSPEPQNREVSVEETQPKLTQKIAVVPEPRKIEEPVMAPPEKAATIPASMVTRFWHRTILELYKHLTFERMPT